MERGLTLEYDRGEYSGQTQMEVTMPSVTSQKASHECPEMIDITSQKDIHDDAFDNFTGGLNISVLESPQLEVLSFADLIALKNLNVDQVPALTQISLPKLSADAETLVYPITYTFTPAILISTTLNFSRLNLPSLTGFGDLVVKHIQRRQLVPRGA
ncbi:hypothetical protein HD806DRAFT_529920 [Xylariaceae sp. AK1471]|nr:hypothetical protein HD806DRAFT_529920 [Xylariaceae sp. AK1471]